ncbi:uncharacterized protein [Amphiura filiformis]|uniref:uncharacterized protein n=1 Tax=Amphiura filiformis TaxID=82378 RepID=UPI003B21AF02
MDATTDPDVDGTGENSTSLRGINKDQESQSETFSISQNNAIDNVSIASSQSEYDNEMMMAVPETSSGKRRRKQQTPQRCTSVIPGLPPASHFDSVTKMKSAAETEFDICHIEPLSSERKEEDIGASSKEVPQIKLQPTTLNRYLQRNKTKSGFHFKRLHRPYFKKCSKGVVRSQPHQCADCGQKFPLRDSLIRHIGLKHTIKIHQCSFCGKQYRLADSLRKHIKRDHSGETHHCVMCDKYFTSKESLKQHWRIHSGEKPYRCQMCNSQFRYRHNYNQHLRTHSGILENCEFCDKQYHRRDSLMKHIKETHRQLVDDGGTDDPQMFTAGVEFTGSNASGCVPLGNSTPGSLKVTDTNGSLANSINRLFHFCRKCSLSFTSRQALLRHMQSRHHKVILVCPICNLQYHLRDSLRKHVKNVHHMKLKDERNTRAELEIRRLFQRPNSCMLVADVEPDSNRGNQQRSSATSTQVSGTAPYPHIAKLKKCPFCDRYYRLRDSLRIHIKSCHMNNDTDSKTETVETTGGNLSVNLLTGESDFFQKEGLPKSVKFTQSEQEHTEEVNSSQEDKSSQVQDPTKDSSDYNSHEMIDSSPPNEGNASEDCEDVSSHSEHNKNSIIQNNQKLLKLNFSCPTCGVKFEDEIELGTHAASHPTCPICQKQYTLRDSLRHHIKRSHPVYHQEMLDRRNNQKEGTKLSSKKGAFAEKEHNTQSAQSDQIGTYGCVTCNVSFPSQEELDIHGKIHLSCPYCPKQYNIKDSLRKHIQSSHPTEYWEKRHVKSYKNVNNNKINSRHDASSEMGVGIGQSPSHHQEDCKIEDFQESITDQILSIDKKPQVNHQHHNLSCSTCGVKFEDEDELDIHAASHPTCLICQKQYTLTDSFTTPHQSVHILFTIRRCWMEYQMVTRNRT